MNTLISASAFALLGILWLGSGAALIFNQSLLDTIYKFFPKQA